MLEVGTQGASMPNRYNYLDLDPTYTDEFGNPLLRMTFDFHEQDRNLAEYLAERYRRYSCRNGRYRHFGR